MKTEKSTLIFYFAAFVITLILIIVFLFVIDTKNQFFSDSLKFISGMLFTYLVGNLLCMIDIFKKLKNE